MSACGEHVAHRHESMVSLGRAQWSPEWTSTAWSISSGPPFLLRQQTFWQRCLRLLMWQIYWRLWFLRTAQQLMQCMPGWQLFLEAQPRCVYRIIPQKALNALPDCSVVDWCNCTYRTAVLVDVLSIDFIENPRRASGEDSSLCVNHDQSNYSGPLSNGVPSVFSLKRLR